MLAYKPSKFFWELEKASSHNRRNLANAYYRAKSVGLIQEIDGRPVLTKKGQAKVLPYKASRLEGEVRLIVMFDIPEINKRARQQLRLQLREWGFVQVQKSVWSSDLDYREAIASVVNELRIKNFVEIFEGVKLSI